jgi:hypothetical protein
MTSYQAVQPWPLLQQTPSINQTFETCMHTQGVPISAGPSVDHPYLMFADYEMQTRIDSRTANE